MSNSEFAGLSLTPAGDAPGTSSRECSGDTAVPSLSPGWSMVWQQVFEHPIALPPEVTDTQLILLERADPFPGEFRDTVWVLNPQTGAVLWRFDGADNAALPVRWIKNMAWSQKYIAVNVHYQKGLRFEIPEEYLVVLDRSSGEVVYTEQVHVLGMTVSDGAVYYRGEWRELNRVDLPAGEHRWRMPWKGSFPRGDFVIGSWLYSFNLDRNVYKLNAADGALVATATLGIPPILGDVLIEDQRAVIRSERDGVVLFDLQALRPRWATHVDYLIAKDSNAFWGDIPSMTLTPNALHLFDAMDNLLQVELASGHIVWRIPSPGAQAISRPIVFHDLVYGLYADGTLRAYSAADGSPVGTVMKVPLWYRIRSDAWAWRSLVGGLDATSDTLIATTGCRSVYAIQRGN
ncbi:MAG TPA: PQQ-binding-like beta-propeller repeat protein [Anaerolineae bacterium]|nr:PQQ-binding-like beta-propeller repeat protein [Anaerolineae bacterium]